MPGVSMHLACIDIPPGMPDMGSPDKAWPVHRARISGAFYIGKYEVKQEEWKKVMGGRGRYEERPYGPRFPMECVTWDDC
jgi:formylglycine-generating enzyme required for sulfatase activity